MTELLIGAVSWLATFGFIVAAIAEAFRQCGGPIDAATVAPEISAIRRWRRSVANSPALFPRPSSPGEGG